MASATSQRPKYIHITCQGWVSYSYEEPDVALLCSAILGRRLIIIKVDEDRCANQIVPKLDAEDRWVWQPLEIHQKREREIDLTGKAPA